MSLQLGLATQSRAACSAASDTSPRPAALRPSIARNMLWSAAGNIVAAGAQWAIVIVLARLTASDVVGVFALALAVTTPVILLASLSLRTLQVTDAGRDYSFVEYFEIRLIAAVTAVLVIAGIAFGKYGGHDAWVIVLVGVAKAVDSVSDICQGALQQAERLDLMSRSMILSGALSLAGLTLGVLLTGQLEWGVVGMIAASALTLSSFRLPAAWDVLRQHLSSGTAASQWRWRALAALTVGALPLTLAQTLTSFNVNLPRYYVEEYLGNSELGIFVALSYCVMAAQTLLSAIAQTLLPRLTALRSVKDFAGYRHLLIKSLTMVTVGGALFAAGAALLGEPVIRWIYGAEYAVRMDVFWWLLLGMVISFPVWLVNAAISAARRFRVQLPIMALAVAGCAAGCVAWVPEYGLVGAAWSLALAMSVTLMLKGLVLCQVLRADGVL